jgi:hypothetical protein
VSARKVCSLRHSVVVSLAPIGADAAPKSDS